MNSMNHAMWPRPQTSERVLALGETTFDWIELWGVRWSEQRDVSAFFHHSHISVKTDIIHDDYSAPWVRKSFDKCVEFDFVEGTIRDGVMVSSI